MEFRAARVGDAPALAELIHMADLAHYQSSGFAVSIGGTRGHQLGELAKLARAQARSQFHYSHFDVAVDQGMIVASVAGFDRMLTDEQMNPALVEIGWSSKAIEGLIERIGPIAECSPVDAPGAWTIDHVATLPQYRGQGLAGRLLGRALERGAAQGYERAVVDVFAGNSKARAIYVRAGFQPACTYGHELLRRILNRDPLERLVRVRLGLHSTI